MRTLVSLVGRPLRISSIALAVVAAIASCSSSGDSGGAPSGGSSGSGGAGPGNANGGRAGAHTAGSGGSGAVNGGSSGSAGRAGGTAQGGTGGQDVGIAGGGEIGGEAGAAGSAGESSNCDDGNAASVDFYKPAYGCGHLFDSDPTDGASLVIYDAGFWVDPKTHYAWRYNYADDGSTQMSQAQAKTYCAAYTVRGLTGFHLSTIDDQRTFALGCTHNATGGSCLISDPGCLTKECGQGPLCYSCIGSATSRYLNPDVPPTFFFAHSSSICSDCAPPQTEWIYYDGNGIFSLQDPASDHNAACVLKNVPAEALPD